MADAKSKHSDAGVSKDAKSSHSQSLIIPPAISMAIIAVVALFIVVFLVPQRQATDLKRQTDLYARQQAALVDQRIAQIQNRLDSLAAGDGVRLAVSEKDTNTMTQLSEELSRSFPLAENALLLPLDSKGITGLRKHGIKLRNNIEASQVNRAEDGEKIFPEAYKYNSEVQFSLVAPVLEADEMEVSGAIVLRMKVDTLQPALDYLDPDRGRSELVQKFGGKETVLLTGGGKVENSLPFRELQIGNSNWWLRFEPSSMVSSELGIPLWSLITLLLIPCLLIPIWHHLSLRKILSSLHADLDALTGYAQSLLSGNKRMPPVFAEGKLNALATIVASFRKSGLATPTTSPDPSSTTDQKLEKKTKQSVTDKAAMVVEEQSTDVSVEIADCIFRAYDIRGDADKYLTDEAVYAIGMAIGSEALDRSQDTIVVASDGRLSSPRIKKALCDGLQASGQRILDIGQLPTPLLYFATHHLETNAGVMITGSHNDAHCNGLKLVLEGKPLSGEHIQHIRQRIAEGNFHKGTGSIEEADVADAYIDAIAGDVAVAQTLKVVVDAGNGIGGVIGPRVLEELGCDVIALHCDVDGNFPNHGPDPTKQENLADLITSVKEYEADFGVAFDGDADRVCVVDSNGKAVAPDVLLMLFAQDIVSRNPGADIVYDVKCTRHLSNVISSYGGRPIMWKSGHSCIKEKMAQTGALLGGEFTGHICFKERWYGFDDGIYSAARLVEIVSTSGLKLNELLEEYPQSKSTPEIIVDTGEEQKFEILEALADQAQFGAGKITTLDGIRVDYPDGWGLIRPSNTISAITMRFEADNDEAMQRIQSVFREQIGLVNPAVASAF